MGLCKRRDHAFAKRASASAVEAEEGVAAAEADETEEVVATTEPDETEEGVVAAEPDETEEEEGCSTPNGESQTEGGQAAGPRRSDRPLASSHKYAGKERVTS